MKILVAGGAGFMGSWIAETFRDLGHNVFILDNMSTGELANIPDGVDYSTGDAADGSCVRGIMRVFNPDVIYNLAAFAREGTSVFSPKTCVKDNIDAHLNLLVEGIRSSNFRKMVYFSSMAVYGDQNPPFSEHMDKVPCDPYGSSKAMCEDVTKQLGNVHGYEWSIVRPHNVFGERQSLRDRQRNVIGIFINSVMRNEPLTIYGDGTQTRAFSYIGNSLDAYTNLLASGNEETYNIGDDTPVSINKIAGYVSQIMAHHGYDRPEIIHFRDRPLEVKHAHCTFDKQCTIGYNKHFGLREGIAKMCKWAQKLGAQPWLNIPVELPHPTMPETWR
jgi:UDP-glucose 4-epimerase